MNKNPTGGSLEADSREPPLAFVRHIHFSFGFFDDAMPPEVAAHVAGVRAANPDFEITVWGPAESRALVAAYYPRLLPKYDAFAIPIQRSDASRYAILHNLGGVYMDLDYDIKVPMRRLCEVAYGLQGGRTRAFVNETPNATALRRRSSNSLMGAAAPGHPFWMFVMDAVSRGWGMTKHQRVLSSAGPQAVDRALMAWRKAHGGSMADVALLPKEQFNPCSVCNRNALSTAKDPRVLAVHTNGGSWHTPAGSVVNTFYCDWPWVLAVVLLLVIAVTFIALWAKRVPVPGRR